jgi:hypothetical protein
MIAVLWGAVLWKISLEDSTRTVFFKSMLIGCAGCIGVQGLQFAGFLELTQRFGLAPQDVVVSGWFDILRIPGMEKHVNGSAAVVSLAVPITIGLVEEKRLGRKWLPVVFGLIVISTAMTLNRSAVLVSGVTIVTWVLLSKSEWIGGGLRFTIMAAAVGTVLIYGPPGGWRRWMDLASLASSENVQVRMQTTLEAGRLFLLHPLGMGLKYSDILYRITGSGSTHNAFLQIALRGGWPIFLAILMKLGYTAAMLFRRSYLEEWIALHLLGLFFFEEYMSNFTIVILVIWLLLRQVSIRGKVINSNK